MKTLTFDIETVPIENLTKAQYDEYKKAANQLIRKRYPNKDYTLTDLKVLRALARSVNPYIGKIITIGLHYKNDIGEIQKIALYDDDEQQLLLKFWTFLKNFDKGLFVSFNGIGFDVPFIIKRSLYHRIRPTNNSFLDLKRYSQYPHFDVKMILSDWDRYATGTLDLISDFLQMPSPKDGEVNAKNVYEAYKDGELKKIAEYCIKDVEATFNIYNVIKDYVYNPFKKSKKNK